MAFRPQSLWALAALLGLSFSGVLAGKAFLEVQLGTGRNESGRKKAHRTQITVAAAASFRNTLEKIVSAYKVLHPEQEIQTIYGSSGKLAVQILNYAPYDLFLSGDSSSIQELSRQGRTLEESFHFAEGQIVVWWPGRSGKVAKELSSAKELAHSSVRKIAIANPSHAPYGKAALEFLSGSLGGEPLGNSLEGQIREKLVFGENALQTVQFAETGAADLAIVPLSLVQGLGGKIQKIPKHLYSPIQHTGVMIKPGSMGSNLQKRLRVDLARRFREFLLSPEGRKMVIQGGFTAVEA